jgi:hypothetical protein
MWLTRGQIVIFDRADKPNVIHRVVDFNGRAAFMSGDACRHSDGWITADRISAIVVEIVVSPEAISDRNLSNAHDDTR